MLKGIKEAVLEIVEAWAAEERRSKNVPWIVCFTGSAGEGERIGRDTIKKLISQMEINLLFVTYDVGIEEAAILHEIAEVSKEGGVMRNPPQEAIEDFFNKIANIQYKEMTLVFEKYN